MRMTDEQIQELVVVIQDAVHQYIREHRVDGQVSDVLQALAITAASAITQTQSRAAEVAAQEFFEGRVEEYIHSYREAK